MSYIINKYDGTQLVVLEDGTLDTSTALGLVGRNYIGYGEVQNENFIFLLENFSGSNPPPRPLLGQSWYDRATKSLHTYNGTAWVPVGAASVSSIPPQEADGRLWYKTTTDQLFVYQDNVWNLIGPESADGFGPTRWRTRTVLDTSNNSIPIVELLIDNNVVAVSSNTAFSLNSTTPISGFNNLKIGINLRSDKSFIGNLDGKSSLATKLENPRRINEVFFDGTSDISIRAGTIGTLSRGNFISGNDFDGTTSTTWSINATSNNIIGTIVSRDTAGDFSAGTITANVVGNLQGNVTAIEGTSSFNQVIANGFTGILTGNSSTATRLQFPRQINGVFFDGSQSIIVTSAADTLTGSRLSAGIIDSDLQTVGTLTSLRVADNGLTVGSSNQFRVSIDGNDPTIRITDPDRLRIIINDSAIISGNAEFGIITSQLSLSLGGENKPAFIPDQANNVNLGHPNAKWNKVYANSFEGFILADAIKGGSINALVYQNAPNSTQFLPIGTANQILRVGPGNVLQWTSPSSLNQASTIIVRDSSGNFAAGTITATLNGNAASASITTNIAGGSANSIVYQNAPNSTQFLPIGTANQLLRVGPSNTLQWVSSSSSNVPSTIVSRDSSGNFAAGTITANLSGTASAATLAQSAVKLQTARLINGIPFDGTANVTLPLSTYVFTYGNTQFSTSGFTNQVGSFNDSRNHFDVFPPAGRSMGNLLAFIPSIAVIHYAGGVDGNDSLRCTWANLGDRIRVWVQNTEQRSTPAANWLAIWS
jgi:fluoride ion exporter CrcB/FEX